jgi:hypothetical protein
VAGLADLASHFAPVEEALRQLAADDLSIPSNDLIVRRYFSFVESLFDLKTACQRYDADHQEFVLRQARLNPLRSAGPARQLTAEEAECFDRYFELHPKLRFDIRCVYVFSKICMITFSGLLFETAGETSQDWKQLHRFLKRISKPNAPPLLQQFYQRFGTQLDWFNAQVNLYRDDFIEHPVATPLMPGLVSTTTGPRLTGLSGTGLSPSDVTLLDHLQNELRDIYPDLVRLSGFDRYEWVCQNLEKVPSKRRCDVENMIRRVGLESGDLNHIAAKTSNLFAGFLIFFGEWRKQSGEPQAS